MRGVTAVASVAEAPVRVLLVEDDPEIARLVSQVFRENGFTARLAASGAEMNAELRLAEVDLVVLDVMLPGESGFNICRRLRQDSPHLPILMLTALSDESHCVLGLEAGADDYVTKPFGPNELVARIRSLLRRTRTPPPAETDRTLDYHFAGWRLRTAERELYSPEGARVTLTSAEFDLLSAFCRHPQLVLSRDQLLDGTHGGLAGPIERSIDVHISRIRQKIEVNPRDPALIKTVRLGGYIFTPAVERQ